MRTRPVWCNGGLKAVFTAQSSYASTVLGTVILSVRLCVTRVLCDETKERTPIMLENI